MLFAYLSLGKSEIFQGQPNLGHLDIYTRLLLPMGSFSADPPLPIIAADRGWKMLPLIQIQASLGWYSEYIQKIVNLKFIEECNSFLCLIFHSSIFFLASYHQSWTLIKTPLKPSTY